MKVRIASQRRITRQRPARAPAAQPLRARDAVPDEARFRNRSTRSVAGEEDPGAALDAPGDSHHA